MEVGLDWSSIVVAVITLTGVLSGQYVQYSVQKRDRIVDQEEHRADVARKEQELKDELGRINEKLDLHNAKLDKHNGFEGRIIALEVIAHRLEKEIDK